MNIKPNFSISNFLESLGFEIVEKQREYVAVYGNIQIYFYSYTRIIENYGSLQLGMVIFDDNSRIYDGLMPQSEETMIWLLELLFAEKRYNGTLTKFWHLENEKDEHTFEIIDNFIKFNVKAYFTKYENNVYADKINGNFYYKIYEEQRIGTIIFDGDKRVYEGLVPISNWMMSELLELLFPDNQLISEIEGKEY